mmetsp:Transcript_925/g.2101  ORF Transcript_925/g.2101 Transcript_925/m.2101 type:complete len:217 (+) Transcript_925:18-668(+)
MVETVWLLFVSAALVHLISSQLLAENVAMRRIDPTIVVLDHLSLVETEFLHVKFHCICIIDLHMQRDLIHIGILGRVDILCHVIQHALDHLLAHAPTAVGGQHGQGHNVQPLPTRRRTIRLRDWLHTRTDGPDDESVPVGELAQILVLPIDGVLVEAVIVLDRKGRGVDHPQLLHVVLGDATKVHRQRFVAGGHGRNLRLLRNSCTVLQDVHEELA